MLILFDSQNSRENRSLNKLVYKNAVAWAEPSCSLRLMGSWRGLATDGELPGGGTLGISGWGCAAGTLEPLTYTRAGSAEFCYPILEQTPQIPPILE